jgi:hypothetical protein
VLVGVRRNRLRRETVVEETQRARHAAGKPKYNSHLAGSGRDRKVLSRKPVAPPWRHDRSLEKAAKNRGEAILGYRATSAWIARQTHSVHSRSTHLRPLCAHPRSGRVPVKAGVRGGVEWNVSSMEISVCSFSLPSGLSPTHHTSAYVTVV